MEACSSKSEISEMDTNHSILDIDGYSAQMLEEMNKLPPVSQNHCIYKVPEQIRQVNSNAYTPVLVSIGPLHHTGKFDDMERDKLKCLKSFIHDAGSNANIDTFLGIVKRCEAKIRDCYAEYFYSTSEELAWLILIDSAFIIQVFRKIRSSQLTNDDKILSPYKFQEVTRDMLLLENQLPFFILKDLYRAAFRPDETDEPSFTDIACQVLDVREDRVHIDSETGEATCCHLLDLLRSPYCPPDGNYVKELNLTPELLYVILWRRKRCPTVTRLYESGIKFRGSSSGRGRCYDITFDKKQGILTIPKLEVSDQDEERLRNLIAFEQCHYLQHTSVTDFYFFLDCLINTPRDVELLVNAGIIQNWLGSDEEACDLFNSLRKYTVLTLSEGGFHLKRISKDLSDYCNRPCNRYLAIFWHKYFSHPWAAMSVFYAVVLLVLTVGQVVTGIISVL